MKVMREEKLKNTHYCKVKIFLTLTLKQKYRKKKQFHLDPQQLSRTWLSQN